MLVNAIISYSSDETLFQYNLLGLSYEKDDT